MSDVRYLDISPEEEDQRLDNYLMRVLKGVPKSRIYRLIRHGEVRINKKRAKPSTRICAGDVVRIPPVRHSADKSIEVSTKLAQRLQQSIVYEDNQLLVMNKPAGIAVHGGSGLNLGLIEALRKSRSDLHYIELIHRLDKETSGCLLLAKKRSTLRAIHALLESRNVVKTYWALLAHPWQGKKALNLDVALEKNILKSGERIVVVSEAGKASQTTFTLLDNFKQACLMEVSPKTGRTHQIRVHSAHLNHPVLGDDKYDDENLCKELNLKPRLYLHARSIQFNLDGKDYFFQADLDEKFSQTLEQLREGASFQ